MEKILHKHLISFFNDNSLLTNCQFGFRSNRGTESQLLSYQASLLNNYVSKATTHSVYIDFKKAFDTVSTKKLLLKLTSYGISSKMQNWLCSFLTDRTQQINVNGKLSEEAKVLSGVPQGSVLGPLLFLIFVNDIGDSFASNFLLYADDLKLFSTNADDIENDLEKLEAWCDSWQMSVAPSKCEAISFCHRKRLTNTNPTFSINDEIFPTVDKIRDLGVMLSSSLSFSEHLATTIRKAHQRNLLKSPTFQKFKISYRESTIDESLHTLIGEPYRNFSNVKSIWYFRMVDADYYIHIVLDTRDVKDFHGRLLPKVIIFTRFAKEDTPFF
ncbi:hypothetical protein B9Z55_021411 [Caenorhabditis nigoni]|uniref:Reverse transcriptase domain-containing protein n=1 Tax=Caenorhabditis nigoni TaxID=1611254 RepID=A0A2G5TRT9_9PELO|nr:hypothetical protein B9Z55_021411 [Caenorhabditis nigoni]